MTTRRYSSFLHTSEKAIRPFLTMTAFKPVTNTPAASYKSNVARKMKLLFFHFNFQCLALIKFSNQDCDTIS